MLAILSSAVLTYDHQIVPIQTVLDAMSRYLLAVPASVLAALGVHYIGKNNPYPARALPRWMNGAAIGFGIYAFSQIFVAPIAMFPASLLNNQAFLEVTGFPVQGVRTAMAILITVCLIRATQITEEQLKHEMLAAQQARLDALEQKEALRRELLRHTVRAQEEERSRIARELHDETAQTLTAFSLELATLRAGLAPRSASARTVERLLDLSRQVSQSLYRLMTGLRPMQLDELGIVQAIRSLIQRDHNPHGFDFRVEVSGTPIRLDPVTATVLFRVAQEALSNAVRHSGVREGSVEVCFGSDQVTLRVSDAGHGFDPAELFRPPRGWGLEGMKDRVESVGGTLLIRSAPGRGTQIEVNIPTVSITKETS